MRLESAAAVPGFRYVDPKVLAKISNLELLARFVVEGFINGLHRSPHLGASMDFAEHRPYMPGDDIRRIDWRLYARSDRFYVKEFEADTNVNFSIVLDRSKSMDFAGKPGSPTKLEYAKYLAACLEYFCHQQRDRIGLVTIDADIGDYIPCSAKHLQVILHTLDRLKPGVKGELELPLRKLSESYRRRSMIALISDFYEDPAAVIRALTHLRGKGNDVICFHVLDSAEIEFPFGDFTNFQDLETGERIPVVPDNLRTKYKALIAAHIAALQKAMGDNQIDYCLVNTAMPLEDTLFKFLGIRQALNKVR